MAPRRNAQAAELMEAEQAEREETADVNEAIARTDSEVFTDALGDEPLDDEAGTELEEMGDGLEGDELDEEGQEESPPQGKQQAAAPEGEESAEEVPGEPGEDGGEEAGDADGEGVEAPVPVEQRPPQPSIPPRVLRETRERARENESRLEAQIRDLQMRLDNFARQPQPQQPQPQPQRQEAPSQPPDQFSDPAGHDAWLLAEGERRAQARLENMWQQMQQQQQRDLEGRLNESLSRTAQGPRSYEFNVAYRDLTSGPQTPEHAAMVRGIIAKPDPGQAILDWWEQTSNPDYIEYHRDVVRQQYAAARAQRGVPQRNGNGNNGQMPVQSRQVPRHEVRLPRSLSDAAGGRSQHTNDPEMFDGAEESIFAYGARR